MILSDERISFLSHQIVATLLREGLLKTDDESTVVQEIKHEMIKFIKLESTINQKVHDKVASIKRNIPEGSSEWDVLFNQYYNEEMNKLK